MVWQMRLRIAAFVAVVLSATGLASCCVRANRRSARFWAIRSHSASDNAFSVSAVLSNVRANTLANPRGTIARGSIHPAGPVLRP
jgi:hypothetical protein